MNPKIELSSTYQLHSLYLTVEWDGEPIKCDRTGKMFTPTRLGLVYRCERDHWTIQPARLSSINRSHVITEGDPLHEWVQQVIVDHHPAGHELVVLPGGVGADRIRDLINAWLKANRLPHDARWYVAEPAPRVVGDKIIIWEADAEPDEAGFPARRSMQNIRREYPLIVLIPPILRAE